MAQRHWHNGGAVLAAGLMVGVCAGAAGCSGSPAAAENPHGAGDAVRTLRRAAGALDAAGTSRARTAMEMATGGTRVTIRGEGVYDFRARRGRLTVRLPQDPTGASEHRPITELLTPGALYMKNRGAGVPADKWVRIQAAALSDGNLVTGGATDPYAAAEVLRGTRTATYLGTSVLAGTPVRHYRGTADLALAARAASPGNAPALRAAARGFATAEVPFDVYLDEQGRIRKLRHRFSFVNGQRKAIVAVASTTLLYDFGAPAAVRLPRPHDIYAGHIAENDGEGGGEGGDEEPGTARDENRPSN
ncbi:hypothetical protein ACFOOM_12895 [Streptomyces echinoruber]|uniref:Lipoprotein n=1 Tax=Streptomyces echinoruber TaxID=68898 RepID=A0A918VMK7_9ACTN|nr:hypothetical protein [Streptomyces echinoruber]GHA09416.1 lipoprotein [Streptomyces echinoruber]